MTLFLLLLHKDLSVTQVIRVLNKKIAVILCLRVRNLSDSVSSSHLSLFVALSFYGVLLKYFLAFRFKVSYLYLESSSFSHDFSILV